jgi:membrane-associated PAP2 superfamily phosphatase
MRCPTCNLLLERNEQGYQVGSYMFNIVAAELLFGAVLVGVLWLTWPAPPWDLLQYGGAALMILAPFLFFPFSKTLFLAFDLVFRPPTSEELS